MGLLEAGKNSMLDHLGSESVLVRLYDDADAEILNISSASQDKTISWNSATGGSMSMASSIDFEIPAGTTVGAISFRSADGATEYARDVLAVENQETYTNDGTYTLSTATFNLN